MAVEVDKGEIKLETFNDLQASFDQAAKEFKLERAIKEGVEL
jgi:hypothetical protein